MLGGIAVNNSIMLVDVFNTLHKKKGMYRALLEAGQERLRPIVSTSTTNVLGMLPLLFQKSESGSLWTPLAMTIVGGLASSTILILFILPGFYLILNDVKTWCAKFMEKYSAV